ncbi:hypothetical protein C161_30576 [Paenibacillus sp. FSL R5-192]|uniref:hypothetical protein n=1 Tax=Paenibacillus sp. FSL R5-192 TaxID=1226754 RepID=UPI0003E228DF|nr:hypothetical protein [Paenibacillus sp. FSL R5-192]ETT29466.1 hypothetical protein C161_30576 [Paenibacillus sp. FSL R5-192]
MNFGLEVNQVRLVGLFGLVSGLNLEPAMPIVFIYLFLFVPLKERVAINEAINTNIKLKLYGFPLRL